jgi:hypothetical protein
VWAVNFFVVLPVINPQFVDLVPYAISLVSKVLFGVAAAGTLQRAIAHLVDSVTAGNSRAGN